MARTMADRIGAARQESFVGRHAELKLFDALVAGTPQLGAKQKGTPQQGAPEQGAVVFVHGPAGIGKTTLLRQFATRCQETGVTCLHIDARDVPPTLDALTLTLSAVLDGEALTRTVVLLDGYELLGALDTPFRERLAPRLPAEVVLVLAGQQPPSAGWRTDPGWAPILHAVKLGNLSPAESGAYLTGRAVPGDLHATAISFTHGHPLALALVGEVVKEKGSLPPGDTADVVRVLIDRLLDVVPSQAHRAALEAAAQVRVIDEPLLAALMGAPDTPDTPDTVELFAWMRGLPFVDAGPTGLSLHDLAREVLAADLRWRHAQRHAELHNRARKYYLDRLDGADPVTQSVALLDLIYLHPDLRAFLQAPEDTALLRVEAIRAGDETAIAELVSRHEGDESATIARHWLARQPGAWLVVREPGGDILGTVAMLALDALAPQEGDDDPAVAAAFAELANHPPLRPTETATLIRFWLSRDHYQSVSPVQNLIATQLARHYLTTAGLAVTLLPFASPQEWLTLCAYTDQRRAPQADFIVEGRRYSTFVHDWRTVPPAAWIARLSMQEIGAAPDASAPADTGTPLVLSEAEFAKAVRQALRDYTRPDRLRGSPLLRCRLITTRTTSTEPVTQRVDVLRSLVKDAVETLSVAPADRRLHRVLVRAYLSPARSLERAAEVLELPSSTFRRLLDTARARVATVLWHQELDA